MLSCWFVALSSGADSHSCDNRLCHATACLDIDSVGPTLAVCHRHTLTHPGPTPTQTWVRHCGYKKEGASCWTPKTHSIALNHKKFSSLKRRGSVWVGFIMCVHSQVVTGLEQNLGLSVCLLWDQCLVCENRDQSGFFKLTTVFGLCCVCVCWYAFLYGCTVCEYPDTSQWTSQAHFLSHAFRKNFSRGTVILSSTHSSTKVVFCLCSESPFSQLAASTWGNRKHSTDKPEKHPDKTDYKQRARVQKCW